jgi:hypothetical protein
MDVILNFLGGGLSGGLFGILGGLGTAWLKQKADEKAHQYKLETMKEKNKYNLQMITAETEATIKEVEANVKRDQIIMDGKADIEESKNRNKSILKLSENYVKVSLVEKMMFNKSTWSAWITVPVAIMITFIHGLVDISRTLVRVLVTYGSVAFSCYVTYMAFGMYKDLGIVMSGDELYEIIQTMLRLLTFTTSTVIGFWFMDKSMSRKFQK